MIKKAQPWLWGLWFALVWIQAAAEPTPHEQAFAAYQRADYAEAYRIWEGLAQDGDTGAQYALGVMLYQGEGRSPDRAAGVQWFERAARGGLPIAMFNLGAAHWEAQRYETAVEWWRKAADLDDAISQYNLGLAYRLGRGAEKDLGQALHWVRASARHGYEGATKLLPTLEEEYQRAESVSAVPPAAAEAAPAGEPQQSATVAPLEEGVRAGFIAADATAVRAERADDAPVISTLDKGMPVKVVVVDGDWARIQQAGGFPLWVAEKFVTEKGGESRINATNVRARPLPETSPRSPPVGTFEQGERVEVVRRQGSWKQVRAPERLAGWVPVSALEMLEAVNAGWWEAWHGGR